MVLLVSMTSINQDLKVDSVGEYLKGKSIALCITGGIAAIETPKIARMLRRYGADVSAIMTKSAEKFVGKTSLEWATAKPVTFELSGLAEHISTHDAVLVAPATLNSINKFMSGIADDSLSTLLASSLGKHIPIYLCPTMHESLWNNPILQENIKKAISFGVNIIPARISEGKMKIPHVDFISALLAHDLSDSSLKGKKILVTGGPTPGKIDSVRRIVNKFRGGVAVLIAKELFLRGAKVKLLLGSTGISVPEFLDVTYHEDYHEYRSNVLSILSNDNFDCGVFSAAVADYIPTTVFDGKIKSDGSLKSISLVQTTKVIDEVKDNFPNIKMITFKYEEGISQEKLLSIAKKRLEKFDVVVANRGEDQNTSDHAFIMDKSGIQNASSKNDLAVKLANKLEVLLR